MFINRPAFPTRSPQLGADQSCAVLTDPRRDGRTATRGRSPCPSPDFSPSPAHFPCRSQRRALDPPSKARRSARWHACRRHAVLTSAPGQRGPEARRHGSEGESHATEARSGPRSSGPPCSAAASQDSGQLTGAQGWKLQMRYLGNVCPCASWRPNKNNNRQTVITICPCDSSERPSRRTSRS